MFASFSLYPDDLSRLSARLILPIPDDAGVSSFGTVMVAPEISVSIRYLELYSQLFSGLAEVLC